MAIVSFKFSVIPSKEQEKLLKLHIKLCKAVQKQLLDYCFEQLRSGNPVPSHFTLCNMLPGIKGTQEELKGVNSQVLQNSARRVALAMKKVLTRNADYKTVQSSLSLASITYPQWGKGCRLREEGVYLDKVGLLAFKGQERITGTIKNVMVTKTHTGRWYVVFNTEVEEAKLGKQTNVVGIDFGIKNFVTLSNGEMHPFPKELSAARREIGRTLKKIRAAVRKTVKNKLQRRVRDLREVYKNQVTDFLNKLVALLVRKYSGFCVEDINKEGMRGPIPRSIIRGMPWRRFIGLLRTKCTVLGRSFELVSPVNTSRKCSNCGNIKERLLLKDRTYQCEACNFTLDRDHNAAINVLMDGMEKCKISSGQRA